MYAAQKKRDDASLGRMRLVNEEKEDVIERLRSMERRLDEERYDCYIHMPMQYKVKPVLSDHPLR